MNARDKERREVECQRLMNQPVPRRRRAIARELEWAVNYALTHTKSLRYGFMEPHELGRLDAARQVGLIDGA